MKKRHRIEIKLGKCPTCNKPISRRAKFCGKHRNTDLQKGENHYEWKGDKASYSSIHVWVSRRKGKPRLCEHCGTTTSKKFEWANISGNYKRVLSDWVRLCTKCHHHHDKIAVRGWITKKRNENFE